MKSNDIKVITDPIHGLIEFNLNNDVDYLAWQLLQCKEFLRLRHIKQQGFAEFAYPSATHSRFTHCIGAFNVARRLLNLLIKRSYISQLPMRGQAAAIAVLLHDVGHGPFSHAFEESTAHAQIFIHEEWTFKILTEQSDIGQLIIKIAGEDFLTEVRSFFQLDAKKDIYSMIVSSQFDADRIDYIIRDRYMSGIRSGGFDLDRLLSCLEVGKIQYNSTYPNQQLDIFVLNTHGTYCAVEYLYARLANYKLLVTHRIIRAYRLMLADLFQLIPQYLSASELLELGIPRYALPLLQSQVLLLDDFIKLNDHNVWYTIEQLCGCKNKKISELALRIIRRKPYKNLDLSSLHLKPEQLDQLLSTLNERQLPVKLDQYNIGVYQEEANPFENIYVYTDDDRGTIKNILDVAEHIKDFKKNVLVSRLYCINDDTAEIHDLIKNLGLDGVHHSIG